MFKNAVCAFFRRRLQHLPPILPVPDNSYKDISVLTHNPPILNPMHLSRMYFPVLKKKRPVASLPGDLARSAKNGEQREAPPTLPNLSGALVAPLGQLNLVARSAKQQPCRAEREEDGSNGVLG